MVLYKIDFENIPLYESLNQLRLEKKEGDVTVVIDDEEFVTNRCVLMSMFEYFNIMFTLDCQEKHSSRVNVGQEFVRASVFPDLLQYAYTWQIDISDQNVCDLLVAAHYLKAPPLLEETLDYMNKNLNSENVLDCYFLACKYEFETLKKSCCIFITENIQEYTKNDYVCDIEYDDLQCLIQDLKIYLLFWKDIYSLMMKWIHHDPAQRIAHLASLLNLVSLKSLPRKFLKIGRA